jgi:hypothetical protein
MVWPRDSRLPGENVSLCGRWPITWLPGMILTQPISGVASVSAIQAVTCSAGSNPKYVPS